MRIAGTIVDGNETLVPFISTPHLGGFIIITANNTTYLGTVTSLPPQLLVLVFLCVANRADQLTNGVQNDRHGCSQDKLRVVKKKKTAYSRQNIGNAKTYPGRNRARSEDRMKLE